MTAVDAWDDLVEDDWDWDRRDDDYCYEPSCSCMDRGWIPARIAGHRRERRCPGCNPTWLSHRLFLLRWAAINRWRRLTHRRAGTFDDEAPF